MTYGPIYGLMDSLRDHLQDKLIDNVPVAYATSLAYTDKEGDSRTLTASLVKVGRLQEDPTELSSAAYLPSVYVGIRTGGDDWVHEIAGHERGRTNLEMHIFPREIGGGQTWWRRFKIDWSAFFTYSDQTQAEAARLGNLIPTLIERYSQGYSAAYPHGWVVGGTQFAFGETALASEVAKSWASEQGGPDDDYIWRGEVWIQVLTEIA